MEDLPLGRIAALVPEFAVKYLPLGRTLMMMMIYIQGLYMGRRVIGISGIFDLVKDPNGTDI